MKILYGIQCTGNGHISRSMSVIKELERLGNEVDILISGQNSSIDIPHKVKWRFKGLTFFNTKSGGINYIKTLKNLDIIEFIKDIRIDISSYDRIISDFEPITAWAAKSQGIKTFGISNQCSFFSNEVPRGKFSSIGELILKWTAPVNYPIGLHYNNYDNFIFKPIISEDINNLKTKDEGHYTVYLPYFNLKNILVELNDIKNERFHIFHKDARNINRYKNCTIYPVDRISFLKSFSDSHGIITNSGFQTTSDALYLSKKLMVIPVKGQYEQENNTKALSDMNIFSGGIADIKNFVNSEKVIVDKWDNPIKDIIRIVLN